MKRIQSACICQTLHFILKDDVPREEAAAQVAREVEHYKASLEKNHIRHKLL